MQSPLFWVWCTLFFFSPRNLAHTKDSKRGCLKRHRALCAEKLVRLYAPRWGGTGEAAFLLFFHLLPAYPPTSLPPLSISTKRVNQMDLKDSVWAEAEEVPGQEAYWRVRWCGALGEVKKRELHGKTDRQLEGKGEDTLPHPLDPVCVLIQLIARLPPVPSLPS